jgi:hypothetical protein
VIPEAISFRIFQDMLGTQRMYRILPRDTTVLTQSLSSTADIIYVQDASSLSQPNPANNIFGQLTINGERITYRTRNVADNTVSGLLRGTAGTAIAAHAAGSVVYNLSRANLAPEEYQNRPVFSTYLSDGVVTEFVTTIDLAEYSLDFAQEAVEVYVGGALQPRSSYVMLGIDPVTIDFDDAPPEGQEVIVVVRQGLSWYQPGASTASNGQPLQETNTLAARFFRDLY